MVGVEPVRQPSLGYVDWESSAPSFAHNPNPMAIKYSKLKTKWYYRGAQVMFWLLVIAAFIAPAFQKVCTDYSTVHLQFIDNSCSSPTLETWIINGAVNAFLWALGLYVVWRVIVYIAWGRIEHGKKS